MNSQVISPVSPARNLKKQSENKKLLIIKKTKQRTKLKKGDSITFYSSDHIGGSSFALISLFRPSKNSIIFWPNGEDKKFSDGMQLNNEQCSFFAEVIAETHGLSAKKIASESSYINFRFV